METVTITTSKGFAVCCIAGAKVQHIGYDKILVNGAVIEFPDQVIVTTIGERNVTESQIGKEK